MKPIHERALLVLCGPTAAKIGWLKKEGIDDPFLYRMHEEDDHNDWYAVDREATRYIALIGLGRYQVVLDLIARKHADAAEAKRQHENWEIELRMMEADFLMERDELRTLRPPIGAVVMERTMSWDRVVPCPNCDREAEYCQNLFAEPDWDARYVSCYGCNRVYILDADDNLVDVVRTWEFGSRYWEEVVSKNPEGMPR